MNHAHGGLPERRTGARVRGSRARHRAGMQARGTSATTHRRPPHAQRSAARVRDHRRSRRRSRIWRRWRWRCSRSPRVLGENRTCGCRSPHRGGSAPPQATIRGGQPQADRRGGCRDDVVLRSRARRGSVGMGEAGEMQQQADEPLNGFGESYLVLWHRCCSSSHLTLAQRHLQIFI